MYACVTVNRKQKKYRRDCYTNKDTGMALTGDEIIGERY